MKERNRRRDNRMKIMEEILLVIMAVSLLTLAILNLDSAASDSLNQISGYALTRASVSPVIISDCNLTLEPGLNLVSFYCITLNTPRDFVTQHITQLGSMFEYQEENADNWKIYNPSLPNWVVQDLIEISRTEGYWIEMKSSQNIVFTGGLRLPTGTNLVAGWNLAGNPTNQTKPANESFTSIDGNYSEVRAFNPVTKAFVSHIPPSSGGLTSTKPYQGYWINSTINQVWIVD
jgi:hypothetical protein